MKRMSEPIDLDGAFNRVSANPGHRSYGRGQDPMKPNMIRPTCVLGSEVITLRFTSPYLATVQTRSLTLAQHV